MLGAKINISPVESASGWMLNSGIQSEQGGVHSWFDLNSKEYAYIYSEITGYAITTFLFLHKIYKQDIYLNRSISAAEWLIANALSPCGGVKTRLFDDDNLADKNYSFSGENIFSFDTGMALYGMVCLYKTTAELKYLDAARKMANFLVDRMQNRDGSFAPVYSAGDNKIVQSFDKWSNQPGAFLTKACMGLIELFRLTKEDKFKKSALAQAEFALNMQDSSGRFITNQADNTTHLHPHSYSGEGFLYLGVLLKNDKYIDAARKSVEWSYEHLSEKGINEVFNSKTQSFNDFQRTDILAQVLRLGLIFSLSKNKIDSLREHLLRFQYRGDNLKQFGGFLYSKKDQHINSWCTMFSLQALAIYEDNRLIGKNKELELLI
ncbi:MAG: glycoside hydrolase family 88 protein [Candidatus Omnitrophica bacterium]|nr:glycoside hydrolase family 88 protein [Candidatus Omnitrophota bacterium]